MLDNPIVIILIRRVGVVTRSREVGANVVVSTQRIGKIFRGNNEQEYVSDDVGCD